MDRNKQHLALFFCGLLIIALLFSKFLLSVSMFGLSIISFFSFRFEDKNLKVNFDHAAISRMSRIVQYPSFLIVTSFFFIVVLSCWPIVDLDYWLSRLRIKLPFIILPFTFLAIPSFSLKQIHGLFYFLFGSIFLVSIGVSFHYFLHMEEINLLLKQGQPMPTPGNHIRFSVMVALAIVIGIHLLKERFYFFSPAEQKIIAGITFVLFCFLHLLSVRTGLSALYFALFVLMLHHFIKSKKYLPILLGIVLLTTIPLAAYYFIPSFKTKIGYMKYDLFMYQQEQGTLYADSGRLVSLQVGWDIAKRNPLFGVGAGNLRFEVERIFRNKFPDFKEMLMPHNQFLFVLAGTGIFGLLLFTIAFFYPLFYKENINHPFFLGFYATVFCAFMLEHSIENAMGVAFYSFFLLLMLNHLNQ